MMLRLLESTSRSIIPNYWFFNDPPGKEEASMQIETKNQDKIRKGGALKSTVIQCNQISGEIAWRNRKFSISVCAATPQAAAQAITNDQIEDAVKAAVENTINLDCTDGEGCGDTQRCLRGDVQLVTVRVVQRPAAARCRPNAGMECQKAGESGWTCDIRAHVRAQQQCVCKVPS